MPCLEHQNQGTKVACQQWFPCHLIALIKWVVIVRRENFRAYHSDKTPTSVWQLFFESSSKRGLKCTCIPSSFTLLHKSNKCQAGFFDRKEEKQKREGIISPYFFINPSSRKKGKHYTLVFLERLWNAACAKLGETISLYPGTKHSTASQLMNEHGLNKAELQVAGDWKRAESVNKYAKVEVATRKNLLEGKIKQLGSFGRKPDAQTSETK